MKNRMIKELIIIMTLTVIVITALILPTSRTDGPASSGDSAPYGMASGFVNHSDRFIMVGDQDLHDVIAGAPPYSIIVFDRARTIEVEKTLVIEKPLSLRGLNARLAAGVGLTPLVVVRAENVTVTDFELHGNAGTVEYSERATLLSVRASNFVVERGLVTNASKHGIDVRNEGGVVKDGVIRDILARDNIRDGVSIVGTGGTTKNILIENVRAYNSSDRGAVEASDGSSNITIRNVYAEDCVYAVDVMHDHAKPDQVCSNHLVENVHAVRCSRAVRTANVPLGHSGLIVRNIIAENVDLPVQVSNTAGVIIDGVHVIEHEKGGPLIRITDCRGVRIGNVTFLGGHLDAPAIVVRNSTRVQMEDVLDARVE
jgi:hypothetical protein